MNLRLPRAQHPAEPDSETPPLQQQSRWLPTLTAPRLTLRRLESDDAENLHGIFSDAQTMRFWNQAPLRNPDDVSIFLEASQRDYECGHLYQWGVVLTSNDRIIGLCNLSQVRRTQQRAEVGLVLARAQWGHGYGLEALTALLDHAFDELRLRRIEADVDPRNLHYLRTLETLGFKAEGYLRQRWLVDGQTQDSVLLGLLRNDLRSRGSLDPAR